MRSTRQLWMDYDLSLNTYRWVLSTNVDSLHERKVANVGIFHKICCRKLHSRSQYIVFLSSSSSGIVQYSTGVLSNFEILIRGSSQLVLRGSWVSPSGTRTINFLFVFGNWWPLCVLSHRKFIECLLPWPTCFSPQVRTHTMGWAPLGIGLLKIYILKVSGFGRISLTELYHFDDHWHSLLDLC